MAGSNSHCTALLLALIVGSAWLAAAQPAEEFSVYSALGSKVAYEDRILFEEGPVLGTHEYRDPKGYSAVHLFFLGRHGARLPTKSNMNNINALKDGLFKVLNASQTAMAALPWVPAWVSPVKDLLFAESELSRRGAMAAYDIGDRFASQYPQLVASEYFSANYPTDASFKPRTGETAVAFLKGFLSTKREFYPFVNVIDPSKDTMLRYYDLCEAYVNATDSASSWLTPWLASYKAQIGMAIADRLSISRNITSCEIDALWAVCQHEAGNLYDDSKTCSLFEPGELMVLNYLDDVESYITRGPGNELNYKIAAPLLKELDAQLTAASTSANPTVKARLLFGHSETILPFAALIGLFNSDMPEANYTALPPAPTSSSCKVASVAPPTGWVPPLPLDSSQRVFQSRAVGPYGANAAFVLYRKDGANATADNHLVRFLYNEQIMPFPGCPEVGNTKACKLTDLQALIKPVAATTAKLDELCGNKVKSFA